MSKSVLAPTFVCQGCQHVIQRKPAPERAAQREIEVAAEFERRAKGLPYERCGAISVCTRDKWRCQICGVSTPRRLRGTYHPHAPEVDHIVPLSVSGSPGHVWANVQVLCRTCNIWFHGWGRIKKVRNLT